MTVWRLAAPALIVLALTGCAGGGGHGVPYTPTPTQAAVDAATCTRDDVTVRYDEADQSSGHRHGILTFTNVTDLPCRFEGYPVVFLGKSDGAGPSGLPAGEDPTMTPQEWILEPGHDANTVLNIQQAQMVEGCTIAPTTHILVAPPLDHPVSWEDDTIDVATPEIRGCVEADLGLLTVRALAPTGP